MTCQPRIPQPYAMIFTAGVGIFFASIATAIAEPYTYSAVDINSASSVYFDPAPDSLQNTTGAAIQLGVSGTHVLAYNNGSGQYTNKTVTDGVFASADLAAGALKTEATLGFASNTNSVVMPLGQNNGASGAIAQFGDSFQAFSGNTPFLWTSGTTVNFNFSVTGTSSIPNGVQTPQSRDPGQPINEIFTQVGLTIYKPGGLSFYQQEYKGFDFNAYPDFDSALAAFQSLSSQLQSMTIGSSLWFLGNPVVPYAVDPNTVLAVSPNTPTQISYQFTPNGDFDWRLSLDSTTFLDASMQNVLVTQDFSHTILTSYAGPLGATTYSASGLFPGTVALSTAPSSVPEPSSVFLLIFGITGMGVWRWKESQS